MTRPKVILLQLNLNIFYQCIQLVIKFRQPLEFHVDYSVSRGKPFDRYHGKIWLTHLHKLMLYQTCRFATKHRNLKFELHDLFMHEIF